MEITTTDKAGNTQRVGCGVFAFLIGIFCILWNPSLSGPSVVFKDDASVWNAATRNSMTRTLSNFARSQKVHIVVVTKTKVDPLNLPAEADQALDQINAQQSWIGRTLTPRSGHSITFLFTKNPRLLQVGWGRYTRHLARRAGLDYGAKYWDLQRIALLPEGPPDLIAAATRIQNEIIKTGGSWIGNTIYKFTALVDDEVIPTIAIPKMDWWQRISSLVAVNLYNASTRLLPNFWLFSALLTLIVILPIAVLQAVYTKRGTLAAAPHEAGTVRLGLVAWVGALIYLIVFSITIYPVLGFLVVSAGGRREDLLLAQALGLQPKMSVPIDMPWYFLIPLAVVVLIAKGIALAHDENESEEILGFGKSLIIVPIACLMLPAWAVIIYAFLCVHSAWTSIAVGVWVDRSR
jgi:hypothetical protein